MPMSQMEGRQPPSARRERPPTRYRTVQVRRLVRVTPRLARVTFGGDDMLGFTPGAAADSIKLTFPAPGQKTPTMPTVGPNGTTYSAEQELQPRRAYTIRGWDPKAGEFDVDIVLHGHGPGAGWAATARPGDSLVIGEPRGSYQVDPAAPWMLLAGDEAALPAIGTILRELPPTAQAQVYLEVFNAKEEQPLPTRARANIHWMHRESDTAPAGLLLAAELGKTPSLPEGRGRVWLACEAAAMRDIRKHLMADLNYDRTLVSTQGYWKHGAANHSDHDWGTQI